jgi:hypothetical protein
MPCRRWATKPLNKSLNYSPQTIWGILYGHYEYPYSSYKSYVSTNKDDKLSQDLIFGMHSGKEEDAKGRYRRFVETETEFKGIREASVNDYVHKLPKIPLIICNINVISIKL